VGLGAFPIIFFKKNIDSLEIFFGHCCPREQLKKKVCWEKLEQRTAKTSPGHGKGVF
jgi:hypothetical protein